MVVNEYYDSSYIIPITSWKFFCDCTIYYFCDWKINSIRRFFFSLFEYSNDQIKLGFSNGDEPQQPSIPDLIFWLCTFRRLIVPKTVLFLTYSPNLP
jgi:hypothetical protein